MKDTIDILMVTYDRMEFTLKSIAFLTRRTPQHRLIVVDNGSKKQLRDRLAKLKGNGAIHHLVLLGENYGIHAGKNIGLSMVQSEPYFIDMDNDILVPDLEPDWIAQLTKLMDENTDYGAISLMPQVLVGQDDTKLDKSKEIIPMSHIGAHGRILRTPVVKRKGGWKPTYDSKRNDEDRWIAQKLKEEGYKVGYARDIRCRHLFGKNWGYDIPIEEHGHNPMWPPSEAYDSIPLNEKTWRPNG